MTRGHRQGLHGARRNRSVAGALALAGSLAAGCSLPVENLRVETNLARLAAPIDRRVILTLPPGFAEYEAEEALSRDPLARRFSTVRFPLGAASIGPICDALRARFAAVAEPCGSPDAELADGNPDVAVEPAIVSFSVSVVDHILGKFLVEVRYRMDMRSADGDPIATWRVHGIGMNTKANLNLVRYSAIEHSAREALANASSNLAASIDSLPELASWRDGEASTDYAVTASPQQILRNPGGSAVTSLVDGVLWARADPADAPDPESENIIADLRSHGAISLRLTIENLGSAPLILRRPDIVLSYAGGASGTALAAEAVASRIAPGGKVAPPVTPSNSGPGGLVLLLLQMLSYYSALEKETSEQAVLRMLFRDEALPETVRIGPGETVSGYAHFYLPGVIQPLGSARLTLPVVRLDQPARYRIVIPLDGGGP